MSFLSTTTTARILGVCEETVRNLDKRGELVGFRDHRGRRKFNEKEVQKLKEKRRKLTAGR